MQDDRAHPDHSSAFHCAPLEQCPVADCDVLFQNSGNFMRGVDYRVILNIAARADDDLPFVAAQDDTVPDACTIANLDISDDHCRRGDKYIASDRWAVAFIFDNHLITTGAPAFSFISLLPRPRLSRALT